jgi:CheY-like chemotaxis protein
MRFLVVDDSRLIRQLATLALEAQAGWQVATAESGAEALVLAARDAPEAILLDSVMPDMDGPSTLSKLQADPRTCDIPVILVTARAGAEDRDEYERIGAAGVIAKPFEIGEFAQQVSAILNRAA